MKWDAAVIYDFDCSIKANEILHRYIHQPDRAARSSPSSIIPYPKHSGDGSMLTPTEATLGAWLPSHHLSLTFLSLPQLPRSSCLRDPTCPYTHAYHHHTITAFSESPDIPATHCTLSRRYRTAVFSRAVLGHLSPATTLIPPLAALLESDAPHNFGQD